MREILMTKLWCPFVKLGFLSTQSGTPPQGSNRVLTSISMEMIQKETNCIGSQCAMWVKHGEANEQDGEDGDCGLKQVYGQVYSKLGE